MIGDRDIDIPDGADTNNNSCEEASLPRPGDCSEDHPQGQGKDSGADVASPPSPSIREESSPPPPSPGTGSEGFKMPLVLIRRESTSPPLSMMARLQSAMQLEMDEQLPLKTPERQMCPSPSPENMAMGKDVRKRSFQISPTEEGVAVGDCVDSRKRMVSKLLTFGTSSASGSSSGSGSGGGGGVKAIITEKKAVRSLFGAPTQEENERVIRVCDDQAREEYERFRSRYFIVEGDTLVSLPPYDAAT